MPTRWTEAKRKSQWKVQWRVARLEDKSAASENLNVDISTRSCRR